MVFSFVKKNFIERQGRRQLHKGARFIFRRRTLMAVFPARGFIASDLQAQPITITAVGDIMLAGRAEEYLKEKGLPYSYPFDALRDVLSQGDIEFANLEGPVTREGE